MKRLSKDPWLEAAKVYKIGSVVTGEVNRLTPFGAFVKLSDEINGLIHVTEIPGDVKDPSEAMKIGDKIEAKVIAVEPEEHRVGLSIKALTEKPKKEEKEEVEEVEGEEKKLKKETKTKEAKAEKEGKKDDIKKPAKKPIKRTTKKKGE